MSYDADKDEVREAVERGDVEWLWSVIEDAYIQRDTLANERAAMQVRYDYMLQQGSQP